MLHSTCCLVIDCLCICKRLVGCSMQYFIHNTDNKCCLVAGVKVASCIICFKQQAVYILHSGDCSIDIHCSLMFNKVANCDSFLVSLYRIASFSILTLLSSSVFSICIFSFSYPFLSFSQEFCIIAVVGLLCDFFLQIVFFPTVLFIDLRRMEVCCILVGCSVVLLMYMLHVC